MRSFFLSILLIISLVLLFSMQNKTTMGFTPALQSYCDSVAEEFELISAERKKTLDSIAQYISAKKQAGETCNLTFICVHNSRRSHFGQAWDHRPWRIEEGRGFAGGIQSIESQCLVRVPSKQMTMPAKGIGRECFDTLTMVLPTTRS